MKRLIREDYERRNEIVEKAIEVIEDNADNEIIETGWVMDSDWRNTSSIKDIIYSCNFNAPVAFSSGNYYGNATRKAVEEMISELDDADDIIDLYNQEIQMGNGYRWSVNFKFDYGEYPDYPEDGYVLYAEFIDGNGNKHISDNTAFITMNDDEDTIEKKVSVFMDNLKFSDTNELKEFKTIKEAIKVPSSAKKKGNDLINGIEDSYYIKENKIDKRRTNMKRTIKEYVEPKTFEDKALFDDFKDSIGGRCFNKDSVYRWVYKLTDIKPTDDEIYEIMDKWVKNKWAFKKENERTGANFYYFDLKETVNESKNILIESSGFQKGITDEMDKFLNYIKKK